MSIKQQLEEAYNQGKIDQDSITIYGYIDSNSPTFDKWFDEKYGKIKHQEIKVYTEEQFKEVLYDLSEIIFIVKRDTTNPKYDGYYNTAREVMEKYGRK